MFLVTRIEDEIKQLDIQMRTPCLNNACNGATQHISSIFSLKDAYETHALLGGGFCKGPGAKITELTM